MGDGEEKRSTKNCPDCAEPVLLAARRCRHCGYRFDEPESLATDRPGDGWLALVRRPPRRSTIPVYLSQAGVMLDDDEDPFGMWLGRVNGRDAYIITTSARLFVTGVRLDNRRPSLLGEYSLRDVVRVDVVRRRLRPTLEVELDHSVRMVVTKLSRSDVRALCACIPPRSP
jgi:hypothetical protein